jgi:hypothetical protein
MASLELMQTIHAICKQLTKTSNQVVLRLPSHYLLLDKPHTHSSFVSRLDVSFRLHSVIETESRRFKKVDQRLADTELHRKKHGASA